MNFRSITIYPTKKSTTDVDFIRNVKLSLSNYFQFGVCIFTYFVWSVKQYIQYSFSPKRCPRGGASIYVELYMLYMYRYVRIFM